MFSFKQHEKCAFNTVIVVPISVDVVEVDVTDFFRGRVEEGNAVGGESIRGVDDGGSPTRG